MNIFKYEYNEWEIFVFVGEILRICDIMEEEWKM